MSGFVYIWYDKKYKRFYIGSHWGSEDDGYICSSPSMREAHRRRPEDFKRKILKRMTCSHRNLLMEEQRWLYMVSDSDIGKKYYNKTKQVDGKFWWLHKESKKQVSEKISKAQIGKKRGPYSEERLAPMKAGWIAAGKPNGSEVRSDIIKQAHTKGSYEQKRLSQIGTKRSEETKKKMSVAHKGNTHGFQKGQRTKGSKGMHWFTNDDRNILTLECPLGFRQGRS